MKLEIYITNDGLIAVDLVLQQMYNPNLPLTEMQKVYKSIGFDLAEIFEKKRKSQIKKASLFTQKKKVKVSLKYYQAWALKALLLDMIEFLESPYQKACVQDSYQPTRSKVNMKNYLVTHKKTKKTMLFKYSVKGILAEFKINFSPTKGFIDYIQPLFPFTEPQVKEFNPKEFRTQLLELDLSFKVFWDTYAYKKGDKAKAEKFWNLLTDVEKAKALAYIPTYRNDCLTNNTAFLYPERYLGRKIFNNE